VKPVRVLAAAAAMLAGACVAGGCVADDENRPVRPPGGGPGGGTGDAGGGGDGGVDGGGGDGGGQTLNGVVCVVSDLRSPDACPAVAARAGVTVAVRGTATTTVSGADGRFTLSVAGANVVLDVAGDSQTLVQALVPAVAGGATVNAPVIGAGDWADVLASLDQAVPDGGGAIAVYVRDGNAAAIGVTFDMVAGSSIAPYYDAGGALSWAQGGGTGNAGVALLVDVPPGTVTLAGVAPDLRTVTVTGVPVVADGVTFVRASLATPP
jgi:hypothetical protein